jgi:hypothetical protein
MMEKAKLRFLSPSELKAKHGMFRATILIDSEIYQIEDDVSTVGEAKMLCADNAGFKNPVAIFDDKGNSVPVQ